MGSWQYNKVEKYKECKVVILSGYYFSGEVAFSLGKLKLHIG